MRTRILLLGAALVASLAGCSSASHHTYDTVL